MRRVLSSLTLAAVLTAAVAVPAFADDNNTQTASNQAVIEQSLASVSGDALAEKWSFAKSGEAEAEAEAKISQKNVQVIVNDFQLKLDLGNRMKKYR